MASYTVVTTREQEAGLNWMYENYVDHATYPTKAAYLQFMTTQTVLVPMVATNKRDHTVALDSSVRTIPDANQAKAQQELEAVIVSNGGTIITAAPPPNPFTPPPVALAVLPPVKGDL